MLKKITAIFAVVAILLSLAACSGDATRFTRGAALATDPFADKIIAKEVAAKYEMTEVYTYAEKPYKTFEYEGKQVLARIENSGNVRVLFEYPLDTEIVYDIEATKRSGNYLYFTKKDAGAAYASLCSVYMPTNTQLTVVDTPCSSMVLLDCKSSDDMYSYGIIVSSTQITVVDLKLSSPSSYSKTLQDIASFIDVGDILFGPGDFGTYYETTVEPIDKRHVMINIIKKNSKGETKEEINFTFNPENSVASF
ncbi:MAG: hypothetical protein IIW48_09440 [Clostridia bacterium]|nr:hypothetical protein [Clostridia bacterium]